jgi:hypothetical protein
MQGLRRAMVLTAILVVSGNCGIGAQPVESTLESSVRGAEPYARWVLDSALAYSPTVRQLVAQIDASDLIAYIQVVPIASRTAHTVLMHGGESRRYVLIKIHQGHQLHRLIELLAHELQHAIEIMGDREVRDNNTLKRLYRRIGLSTVRANQFETQAAMSIERLVRREIVGKPGPLFARRPNK